MHIEYEATFPNIEINDARERLKKAGGVLVRPDFLQKRVVLDMPKGNEVEGGFVRVRDEGDKITLTLKVVDGSKISDQKEEMVTVSNFDSTVLILKGIGCLPRAYEESRRELWNVDGVDVTIDTWPFLGSIVEVEGKSEDQVKAVSEKLNFNWSDAKFCTIGALYVEKYGMGPVDIAKKNGGMIKLVFEGDNPFLNL